MTLPGNAFLIMWHDIVPQSQLEYLEWHTREHMPERLSIPGFRAGKRLVNQALTKYRYGTIYTGDELDVFRSSAYLERLNNPTPWSGRVASDFRNFLRVACLRLASAGIGDGGVIATIRFNFSKSDSEDLLVSQAQGIADRLLDIKGVCCAHVGIARDEVSGVKTRETELRPQMAEQSFDGIIVLEGSELAVMEEGLTGAKSIVAAGGCGLSNPQCIVYNLAYQLTATDMKQGTAQA